MAPSNKAKAAGVSASSFLDLKAELAKQETEFSKQKVTGKSYSAGGVQQEKKPTIWSRPNKGVVSRNARDLLQEARDQRTAESARAALERKAKIYDKLRKGRTGGLSEAQYDALLVDFDQTPLGDHFSSDSEDVDESITVPKPPAEDDDPIVEYEDEFGRVRTARRSEVPREYMKPSAVEEAADDDPFVVYNPVEHFPVYEPSAERLAAIAAAASEEANPLETHYDATREVRAKGAAFYAFSADEEKRQRELEELRRAREETERTRREVGAIDVRVGEVEGMVAGGGVDGVEASGSAVESVTSRAIEKRKRELEERRKLVEAKRKKLKGDNVGKGTVTQEYAPETSSTALSTKPQPAVAEQSNHFATLEARMQSGRSQVMSTKALPVEAKAKSTPLDDADDFLASLEKELVGKGKRRADRL